MKLVCDVLDVIPVSIEDAWRFNFEVGWFADGSENIDRVKESLSLVCEGLEKIRVGIVGGWITMEVKRITVQVAEAIIVVVWFIFEETVSVCVAIKVGRNTVEVGWIPVEFAEAIIEVVEIGFEEFDPVEEAETIIEVVRPIFEDADVTLIDVFFGIADEDGCKLGTISGPY